MLPLALYLGLILGVWSRGEAVSCTPSCDGTAPGGHVPDPTNCQKYYICLANGKVSDFTEECPEGQLFDADTKKCVADGGTCGLCQPVCKFSCSETVPNYEVVADRTDCSTFYVCVAGNPPHPITCSDSTPYFNGTGCTADKSQCCDGCIAYCSERYTQIPDPTNCTNFYFCEYEGYPEETSLYQCATGNFDENAGVCSEEATCNQPCTGGGGTTTTTEGNAAHCVDTFVCQKTGYFPRCTNRCDPHYYHCTSSDISHEVQALTCSNNKVINPDTMMCVSQAECPYPLSSPHLFPPKYPPPPLFTQHSPLISTQISTPTSSHPFPTSSQTKTNKFIESPKDKS
nr:peritrophin-48-like isoform X1 [Procambarus clarkii]